jgi:hypothetical protein
MGALVGARITLDRQRGQSFYILMRAYSVQLAQLKNANFPAPHSFEHK